MVNKKIIIVGKTTSGKDYLSNYLTTKGYKKSISYTTRPIRSDEVDGDVYHFISLHKFQDMISNSEFYEYEEFIKNRYYGSTKKDWDIHNLFTKTPIGLSQIKEEDRKGCIVLYLDVSEKTIIKRLIERNTSSDDIQKRMEIDHKDFDNFTDYDIKISEDNFDPESIYSLIR